MKRLLLLFLCLASFSAPLLCHATEAQAGKAGFPLKLLSAVWGFSGKPVGSSFNQLALLLENASDSKFEGVLRVYQSGMGDASDICAQDVFLAPRSGKWVFFHPFVGRRANVDFFLDASADGVRRASIKLGAFNEFAVRGKPVYISSSPAASLPPGFPLRVFPAALFPAGLPPTAGLGVAVLSEVPSFVPEQEDAFIGWLRSGGALFVAKGVNGGFPLFSGKLSCLRGAPSDGAISVGRGFVRYLDVSLSDLTPELLALNAPASRIKPSGVKVSDPLLDLDTSAFSLLRSRVKPVHNWLLIYSVLGVFLLLVSVGNFILARCVRGRWTGMLYACALILLFTGVTALIGARGYGERAVLGDLTCARSLGDGSYELSQWFDLFLTRGKDCEISRKGSFNCYASNDPLELFGQFSVNGPDGLFKASIMPFASAGGFYAGSGVLPGSGASVSSMRFSKDGKAALLDFSAELRGEAFKSSPPLAAWLLRGDRLYNLKCSGARCFASGSELGRNFDELDEAWRNRAIMFNYGAAQDDEEAYRARLGDAFLPPLVFAATSSLPPSLWDKKDAFSELGGRVELFVLAKTPAEFQSSGEGAEARRGYTVFEFAIETDGADKR